jgi:hypothetical protein
MGLTHVQSSALWTWDDSSLTTNGGSPYFNWASTHSSSSSVPECSAMIDYVANNNADAGKWMELTCTDVYPFVCTKHADCWPGYYKQTDYLGGTAYLYSTGNCLTCPAGQYRADGDDQFSCSPCDAGRMGNAGATSSSCDLPCPIGYYCPAGTPNGGAAACPPGKYGDVQGAVTEAEACKTCPAGSVSLFYLLILTEWLTS